MFFPVILSYRYAWRVRNHRFRRDKHRGVFIFGVRIM
jgi:hypothetical protein